MPGAIPSQILVNCPRCHFTRMFVDVSGGGAVYRCGGCEWYFNLTAVAPTGTSNASVVAGGVAIGVASGGASFTNGMFLLYDTGTNTEVLVVNGAATGTSIPVLGMLAGQARLGFLKAHGSGATFGQLALVPTNSGTGQDAVPANPGWGF